MSISAAIELNRQRAEIARLTGAVNPHVDTWRRSAWWRRPQSARLRCWNWDSVRPVVVTDDTGKCYGTLMPVDRELVAHSPGIQDWSR